MQKGSIFATLFAVLLFFTFPIFAEPLVGDDTALHETAESILENLKKAAKTEDRDVMIKDFSPDMKNHFSNHAYETIPSRLNAANTITYLGSLEQKGKGRDRYPLEDDLRKRR